MEHTMEVILKTKKVCKSFATNGEQNHVLSNVDLEIYKGDFTVIMGSSGSGKSTLLYGISAMDDITSGEVYYKGKEISQLKNKEKAELHYKDFGFVFQQMHLVSNLTLFENVTVPGYLNKKKKPKEVEMRAKELLERVNLENAWKRYPSQVSGGEKQRAAIARAVINEPELVFADEPTGALNRHNTEAVMDVFSELNREGLGIVMVTHDIVTACRGNRLLYLDDGKIVGELKLSPYDEKQRKSRETQITAWLASMSW